jgi:putative ABC transport system ATP-binding protein
LIVLARSLTKEYPFGGDAVHALRGVDLEVRDGEFVAIMGPSGCGKSTLLNLIAGIDDPTTGEIELLGRKLATLDEGARSALRLREVGFVFQRFHLLAVLTAAENVELPMAEVGVPGRERRARARELLEYVGLGSRLTGRRSSRGASSSGSPSPARSPTTPACCWPTSRPASWTARRARRSSVSSRG